MKTSHEKPTILSMRRHRNHGKESDEDNDEEERLILPRRSRQSSFRTRRQQQRTLLFPKLVLSTLSNSCSLLVLLILGCCTLLLVLILVLAVLFPFKTYLIGNGYTTRGGVLGDMADRYLAKRYAAQRLKKRPTSDIIKFPDVTIKATRKKEISHYNAYLEEILKRHQAKHTNVVFERVVEGEDNNDESSRGTRPHIITSIQVKGVESFIGYRANSLIHDLKGEKCASNWMCQRCMNTGFFGQYAKCSMLCRKCYIRLLKTVPKSENTIEITAAVKSDESRTARIPKIIHQAWVYYPRTMEYPELARIQNTWRSKTSYEYSFYTFDQEKPFIDEHYPSIIGKAYSSIESRQLRRDFFKLLVLFKVGGVFANVDLMLETNLDALIEPNTSFFAARDSGLLQNCLWNGFIGAEPGHPILARAIENILRIILTMGDKDDPSLVERQILHSSPKPYNTEIWKIRAAKSPDQYIYQGCALGVAANQILRADTPVSDFELGKQAAADSGDMLILMLSTKDTGATRITDIDRNLLVASSEMIGLNRMTVRERSKLTQREKTRDRAEIIE